MNAKNFAELRLEWSGVDFRFINIAFFTYPTYET